MFRAPVLVLGALSAAALAGCGDGTDTDAASNSTPAAEAGPATAADAAPAVTSPSGAGAAATTPAADGAASATGPADATPAAEASKPKSTRAVPDSASGVADAKHAIAIRQTLARATKSYWKLGAVSVRSGSITVEVNQPADVKHLASFTEPCAVIVDYASWVKSIRFRSNDGKSAVTWVPSNDTCQEHVT
jgi:hypothetical protein